MPHSFDRDTAVAPLGDGAYEAVCSPEWNTPVGGPNGGYVAAIAARAVIEEIADPGRALRSLHLQFLRPPRTGEPLRVLVRIERVGRTVTNVSLRAEQEGKLVILGMALAATDREDSPEFSTPPPAMPAPDEVPTQTIHPRMPPIAKRYAIKPCLGPPPFSGGEEALGGGWIRLAQPRVFDVLAAAAYLDAWIPAPFMRTATPLVAPTLDYTVHLRAPLPHAGLAAEDFVMLRMASATAAGGYFEGDCDIWAPDGTLLAQARQLALLLPYTPPAA